MPIFGYMAAFYPRWDHAYADRLRREFGLDTRTRVKELSKGQRARAGLTIALAYRPELLLLDEPSSGLDPIVRRDILGAIIRTVAEEGRTVVVPIVVVTGTRRGRDRVRDGFLPVWTAMHGEWVRTQPHGRHVLAEKSGHAIHIDEPDLVVGLIREVIDQARTRRGDPSKSLTFSK